MPVPYEGKCACGAIRYRINAEPLTYYICHCTDCQKLSGSAYGLSMPILKETLEVLSGTPEQGRFETSVGKIKTLHHCGNCFTRLWADPPDLPEVVLIRPGAIENPEGLVPVAHTFTDSAQAWVTIPDDALSFAQAPESYLELVEAWNSRST
jgi:hypothetical protein